LVSFKLRERCITWFIIIVFGEWQVNGIT